MHAFFYFFLATTSYLLLFKNPLVKSYHPFTGRMRKRESNPIAPWNIFPPVRNHSSIRKFCSLLRTWRIWSSIKFWDWSLKNKSSSEDCVLRGPNSNYLMAVTSSCLYSLSHSLLRNDLSKIQKQIIGAEKVPVRPISLSRSGGVNMS